MVPSAERTAHRVGNTAWKNQRVVLITGAGRGVGKATARELARRGMKVVLCSRTASELKEAARVIRSEGGVCGWEIANLVREKEIVALCTKVLRTHGRVDALVNNAARIYYGGLAESSCREWDALMDTNLRAPFLLIKHFAPAMARTGGGTIVNVGSAAGLQGVGNLSLYCASKFGLVGLSESLRRELAPKGIRVSCVCPSFINTSFCREFPAFRLPQLLLDPEKVARLIAALICSRRPKGLVVIRSRHWLRDRALDRLVSLLHLRKREPEL